MLFRLRFAQVGSICSSGSGSLRLVQYALPAQVRSGSLRLVQYALLAQGCSGWFNMLFWLRFAHAHSSSSDSRTYALPAPIYHSKWETVMQPKSESASGIFLIHR
ncbi:hypothetical protein L211DRAFT_589993 [Terfezia boudieri ATCC MYA-4762]|uniref:Uncharacterized protein n=1 Tax=Terfezia boudieri ATCC MYA-4762 TaxID=1051890 RepID=A0A3N4LA58_9PEZI|nr:hypothetical protein L211DRAFT_589993 [Terfezia boudieri ATCC MYA-4762]